MKNRDIRLFVSSTFRDITERDADGMPVITFFHRQINEVLRERYGLI